MEVLGHYDHRHLQLLLDQQEGQEGQEEMERSAMDAAGPSFTLISQIGGEGLVGSNDDDLYHDGGDGDDPDH